MSEAASNAAPPSKPTGSTVAGEKGYTGIILGVRADEESTRAKERYFSPRDKNNDWDFRDQPPELWDQFKTSFPPNTHIRIHPLLDWTEINIWEYIKLENIPFMDLYLNRGDGTRYRSLGCAPCTFPIKSTATTVDEIIEELRATNVAERAGRAQDEAEAWRCSAKMATCKTETPATVDIRDRMNIVIVGSVDHGKSTLLGRLYADTGTLPEGKVEKIQAICKQQGKEFEYAFLFDAFLEEQQQGVTIDTARTFFQWEGRQYIIIDAPGTRNS